jgi:hypothetical protein
MIGNIYSIFHFFPVYLIFKEMIARGQASDKHCDPSDHRTLLIGGRRPSQEAARAKTIPVRCQKAEKFAYQSDRRPWFFSWRAT